MTIPSSFELPPDKRTLHRRAVRLEWLTIAYLLSATALLFLTIGQSQAGKAGFIEDAHRLRVLVGRRRRRDRDLAGHRP